LALDRALADDPRYSMALLLREAIDCGAPPSLARLPMTPEEVAASYADLEDGDAGHDDDRTDVMIWGAAEMTIEGDGCWPSVGHRTGVF
jgi:hypothetical protein